MNPATQVFEQPDCGTGTIQVLSAYYGRFNMQQCLPQNLGWVRECSAYADVTQWAQEQCDGQNSCDFYGKPTYAGDPCPNIVKFTVTNYECIPAPEPTCEVKSHEQFGEDPKHCQIYRYQLRVYT